MLIGVAYGIMVTLICVTAYISKDKMSEADEIKRDGATPVKNSGRSKGIAKGDAILEPFLIDYKEYNKTFGVSKDFWARFPVMQSIMVVVCLHFSW